MKRKEKGKQKNAIQIEQLLLQQQTIYRKVENQDRRFFLPFICRLVTMPLFVKLTVVTVRLFLSLCFAFV